MLIPNDYKPNYITQIFPEFFSSLGQGREVLCWNLKKTNRIYASVKDYKTGNEP